MNESETDMTEQPLSELAVQPDTAALNEATAAPEASEPSAEIPTVDNTVPLPMLQPPPSAQPQWNSHEYEMLASGLQGKPLQPEAAPTEVAADKPEPAETTLAAEAEHTAPEAQQTALAETQEAEKRRAAMEEYWKTALTGDPDSIPDSFRARAAGDDLTSSAGETEYDLLQAVNRSWYADHSELSRERIAAEWPRIRTELSDRFGVADDEREVFTALSLAPEEEERRKAALNAYNEAYNEALLGKEPEKKSPWEEEENPWRNVQQHARAEGAAMREEVLDSAQNLTALFSVYYSLEKGAPWEVFAGLWDAPEVVGLCNRMVEMEPQKRKALYEVALDEMKKSGRTPADTENLYIAFRRAMARGIINVDMGLVQCAGNLTTAAANLAARWGDSETAGKVAHSTDEYLRLLEEWRIMAQEKANPIHQENESMARMLFLDAAEATPSALIGVMGGGAGMALTTASGFGSNMAEVRGRAEKGDISLQTAAGLVGLGVQLGASQLWTRTGGKMIETGLNSFARERLAGMNGSFTLKALAGSGRFSREMLGNIAENRTGRGVDLLVQEGASRLEGVASNIDWEEYGKEWNTMELNIREAARTLPYILIGSGHASLHHFRDPHAIVADGAALTQWGVPEETQRRLMNERDPRKQNRLLYDALHNGTRWGGLGFLESAAQSLRLLHTDDFRPFRDRDVVRDFLRLPAETEAERARVLSLGRPTDPAYVQEMISKHAGGSEITDPKKAMPFLLMTEVWNQRAFPEDLAGYPTWKELAPRELTKIGDDSPATEKARAAAVNRTVRYIDALTYRLLMNSTSFSTLTFSGRKPAEVGAEMDTLRHRIIGKVADAVVARAGGASPEAADRIYGQFITDYYGKMRFSSAADSWIRFAPPRYISNLHNRALTTRLLQRGANMPRTAYPELQRAYWVVQGLHHSVQALVNLLPYQADFRTALSRGMTPQEAYAHLLYRELGTRLPEADWAPRHLAEDVTDYAAVHAENRKMVENYTRLTGTAPESREGDDGRTYWRIRKPDKHYTRWHDSVENCINDVAADSRVRFLPLGGDMGKEMLAAHDEQGRYDASRLGMLTLHAYSYYDRLSARATGDMIRFWQEDAARAVPGASIEMYRAQTGHTEDTTHPQLREHPERPGTWQVDARSVRTPLGLLRGRFDAFWRNQLSSGWLSSQEATDFLLRRGVIDEKRRQEIEKEGRRVINRNLGMVTPERFFSGTHRDLPKPYLNTAGMQGLLARHLADYTTSYFLSHIREMPLPDSAREWFSLTPFCLHDSLYEGTYRAQKGRNDAEQTEKWAHRRAAEVMEQEIGKAERMRTAEQGENPLKADPLFPLLRQAILPAPSRSAEQGWAYTIGGANSLTRLRPETWNLMQEPVRGWSLLAYPMQQRLRQMLRGGEPSPEGAAVPVPKALAELDDVLKQYPELHRYELFPGDESRVVQMDIPEPRSAGYLRFDSAYDHPTHEGDNLLHGGFRLQEAKNLPDFFRTDERVMPALRTLGTLRRAVHEFPYADALGVWWNGERYGGKDGKKLAGMDDTWYAAEPMDNIRRIFREMPEDGSPVMTFDKGISFGRRESLPDDAFLSTTVYRSPMYPLSQVRLMPGERAASFPISRDPYVTHSFIAAPMDQGMLTTNDGEHNFYLTPLEEFHGDVTRELIGHMAGWWGKQTVESALAELMHRTKSPELLLQSNTFELSNREVLMQLTEDCRFSASLEGRSPHELNAEEALAATWFHALAEYETGTNRETAAKDLLRMHEYFEEHPERLQAVEDMLKDHRLWYGTDPTDQWYHVITGSRENRHAKQVREEMERREWLETLRNRMRREAEFDAVDFANRIGKPKTYRKE